MGTRYPGTKEEIRALDAYIKLSRAAESVSARIHRHLEAEQLTATQFGVLEALLHLGSLSQRELAQKLLRSGGNITLVIDNLEKRQLVKRMRAPKDRRVVSVCLSEKGEQLISEIFARHVAVVVDEMSILTETEQEELSHLCRRLGTRE
ncbi:MAG: MarR family transcriptional regulator [Cyanobacteria bacterium QH_8_48_120]|jgi:MarR family 2-MHQ and catechol resistance regulon transcriptional repressor|nr:MAG: MarR family transcriptional regulator [Cyanobacteria bacterium QH_1_48_107]PSO70722.1 MAG: MarR family transcriptional regulator [Cyanobacteria bacterium QH_8_48_120]PSP29066.1 MAG: MarR family transcriptional regulator [Cyanobacteria bacterium SW_4_48_29]